MTAHNIIVQYYLHTEPSSQSAQTPVIAVMDFVNTRKSADLFIQKKCVEPIMVGNVRTVAVKKDIPKHANTSEDILAAKEKKAVIFHMMC